MLDTRTEVDWQRLKEYAASLERDRSNLWGVNEELREKIGALERGQEDLTNMLADTHPQCLGCGDSVYPTEERITCCDTACLTLAANKDALPKLIGDLEAIRGYVQVALSRLGATLD